MKKYFLFLILFIFPLTSLISADPADQQIYILLGPPGSGKGTQAAYISKEKQIPHISTGDLFRENIRQGTKLGQTAQTYMNDGKLVPDALVIDMLLDRVSKEDCQKGYLLDGFPRTVDQAKAFDSHLSKKSSLKVIYLDVSDDVVMKRISGRESCKNCGKIYNRYFQPPKQEGKCDQCGSTLVQRDDDKPEVVKNRLTTYASQTKPLIDYYQSKGVLIKVNGEQKPEAIWIELKEKILLSN